MHWIDWLIVLMPALLVLGLVLHTRRYVRGVADFLAAGRAAGRYLVCNAVGEAGLGAITVVALFEKYYKSGFALTWWDALYTPVALIMTLSGYIIYRYRETRAMTLAQFFEMRYSRRFRIFMGFICFISGVVNYGIFPAVGARFFIYYCGLPTAITIAGVSISTFPLVMAVLLGSALSFSLMGGQLTAMVADCVEGMLSGVMYVVVAIALLWMLGWGHIADALSRAPENQSLLNPFQTSEVADFNIWYVLIGLGAMVYANMAWQGNQGFYCSAASPHEAKMGTILGSWRGYSRTVMIMLLAACAYTCLHHPAHQATAASVKGALAQIHDPVIQEQMCVPVTLSFMLPPVIRGIFASIMLFALIACDSSYLHSWGSIFIQDVLMPLRSRSAHMQPPGPRQHLFLLRCSIAGVAVFAFCFSLFVPQTDYILMFMALTGAIFVGGAGACIIGGLYWKKGTTLAAWCAMITGSSLAVGGILLQHLWTRMQPALLHWAGQGGLADYLRQHAAKFPLNGQVLYGIAIGCAVAVYITISLLTCRRDFDMDKLLHRGRYAVDAEGRPLPPTPKPPRSLKSLVGIDGQFTRGDKFLSISLFVWSMLWFAVFLIGTIWNLVRTWPTSWWVNYWYVVGVLIPLGVGIVTTTWFTIGGLRDLRRLFRTLATLRRDASDDGTVAAQGPQAPEPAAEGEQLQPAGPKP